MPIAIYVCFAICAGLLFGYLYLAICVTLFCCSLFGYVFDLLLFGYVFDSHCCLVFARIVRTPFAYPFLHSFHFEKCIFELALREFIVECTLAYE